MRSYEDLKNIKNASGEGVPKIMLGVETAMNQEPRVLTMQPCNHVTNSWCYLVLFGAVWCYLVLNFFLVCFRRVAPI